MKWAKFKHKKIQSFKKFQSDPNKEGTPKNIYV